MTEINDLDYLISQKQLDDLQGVLSKVLGFKISTSLSKGLDRKLKKLSTLFGFKTLEETIHYLSHKQLTKNEVVTLAKELTIGETYFFRNQPAMEILEKTVLPKIINKARKGDRTINIWSAGCSSGEEPYSLAIFLERLIPDIHSWKIKILATDINLDFLEKAKSGIYNKWSFRRTTEEIQKLYFSQSKKGHWKISDRIKKHVKFQYFNLMLDEISFSNSDVINFDLVLCNNVLIYFSEDNINLAINKMTKSINESGWLLVSPVEVPYVKNIDIQPITFNKNIFFQKKGGKAKKSLGEQKDSLVVNPINVTDDIFFSNENSSLLDLRLDRKMYLKNLHELYNNRQYSRIIEKLEISFCKIDWEIDNFEEFEDEVVLYIKVLANLGRCSQASDFVGKILNKHKISYMIYYLNGVIEQELNNIDGAIESFKKSLFLNPNFAIAHFYLGTLMFLKNNKKEASRYFRNSIKLVDSMPANNIIPGTDDLTKEKLGFSIQHLMERQL